MKLALKYLPTALHLIVLAVGIDTVSRLHKEYVAARRLYEQMEEDHGSLVKKVIEVNNLMAPQTFGTSWDEKWQKAAAQETTEPAWPMGHKFEKYMWEPARCGYVDGDELCGYPEEEH